MDESVRTLFLGLNTVDLQFFVDKYPEANTKTKATRNEICAGGPATNAAIACAFLGAKTTLITPVGRHSLSRFISDDITNHKVFLIDPIQGIDSTPVFASIITSEQNGERTIFSYHPKQEEKTSLIKELKLGDLSNYDVAMFDGFYPEFSIVMARKLKEAGVTTVLDGGSWKPGLENLLPYIDIAICSDDFTPPGAKTKYDIAFSIMGYGVSKIAISRGHKSILVYDNEKKSEISVPEIKAVDTLGAGDFFHGAFCYYYAFKPNFEQALKNASSIAAISCQYHGTRQWMKYFSSLKV